MIWSFCYVWQSNKKLSDDNNPNLRLLLYYVNQYGARELEKVMLQMLRLMLAILWRWYEIKDLLKNEESAVGSLLPHAFLSFVQL